MKINQFLGRRLCAYDYTYITTEKFIFFRELYSPFSPLFIYPSKTEAPGEEGVNFNEQGRSGRVLNGACSQASVFTALVVWHNFSVPSLL